MLAAGGVGALVGAVAMGRAREPRRPITWIYGWWTVATLGVAGYGVFEKMWGLVLASVVVNGAEAIGAVVWVTLKQRRVPIAMLGRVSSIDWLVSTALLPLSYALTPPVAHLLGARTTLVLAGTVGAAVTLGFLFLPGMRREDVAEGSVRTRTTGEPPVPTAARPEAEAVGPPVPGSQSWCLCCGWDRSWTGRPPVATRPGGEPDPDQGTPARLVVRPVA